MGVLGHSGVIGTAVHKIGDLIVHYLREFEVNKDLTCLSGAYGELFYEKEINKGRKSFIRVPFRNKL
jgi:hypothetical protein